MGRPQYQGIGIVSETTVASYLQGREKETARLVRDTYLSHHQGHTVNPDSHFLRFPDEPSNRIIALPAALRGSSPISGIKWISSYPENTKAGIPRASAVMILNDAETGFPLACMEASLISAARTAASAALAADILSQDRDKPKKVAFIGTGFIAFNIHHYLQCTGWEFEEVFLHDLHPQNAQVFASKISADGNTNIVVAGSLEEAIRGSDLIVFATVSSDPYVNKPEWFDHHPIVLHVSLRDLGTGVLKDAYNVVDDVEHVLRAGTSILRAVEEVGDRSIIACTLAESILEGHVTPADQTVVFSPFGLGVLDIALGAQILEHAQSVNEQVVVENFFSEPPLGMA